MSHLHPHTVVLAVSVLLACSAVNASPHGGNGGNPFNDNCGSGEVMAGMRIRAGTLIDNVQPVCVKVKYDGSWDGQTRNLGMHGGNGGNSYDKICKTGEAVRGINGSSGTLVDKLEVLCGKLGVSSGKITIVQQTVSMGAVGGTGGNAFSDACAGNSVMLGLSGRSGTLLDNISPSCGSIDAPAAPAFTVSLSFSPASTTNLADYLNCNTAVTITASSSGGPASGTTEYRYGAFRLFYHGVETGEEFVVNQGQWSSGSVTWTPPSAGVYRIKAKARRSGVESSQVQANIYVKMGLTTSVNPPSPRSGAGVSTMTMTATCAPANSTLFYQIAADNSGASSLLTGNSRGTPSLGVGSHTLKSQVIATQGSGASSYDSTKQIAMAGWQEQSYTVNAATSAVSFSTLKETFQHARCTTCHGFNASPSTKPGHQTSGCTGCHTQGTSNWHAPAASADLRNLSDADLCNLRAKVPPAGKTVAQHLKEDELIKWAINDGRLPNGTTVPKAPPANLDTWNQRVDAWIGGGLSCQ